MDPIKRLLACALVALAASCAWAHSPVAPGSPHTVPAAMPAGPLAFEENKGQVRTTAGAVAPDVRYRLTQGNTQLFLLENGIAYQFSRTHYPEGYAELLADASHDNEKLAQLDAMREQVRLETFRMDMLLDGASTNVRITTEGRSSDYTQYYNHDALGVHSYTKVTYHDIYPGIDWVVYTTGKGMKYDFVVRPGVDPNMIRLRFEHHEELHVDADGDLIHGNRMGRFTEERPVSIQDGKEVPTSFVLEGNTLRFALDDYDPSRELTIDPDLIWATYYGGSLGEEGYGCAVDASGNVYLSGHTKSTSGIASGGHQNTYGGGDWDAYLVKFDGDGVRLWATYYGGAGFDVNGECAVDGSGNVYLNGRTSSASGIAAVGHQNSFSGVYDAFLVKFDASGTRLWATYYGGSGYDSGTGCAVDGLGNVLLAGYTSSSTGIASGGHQATLGGDSDAFLVKFSSSGVRLWGTYYGGSAEDEGFDCAADAEGNAYLSGETLSASGIAFSGHQNTSGGASDAFIVKFNPAGTRLWSTYYGGSELEGVGTCSTDAAGNVFLAGTTDSPTGISSGGYQNTYGGMGGGAGSFATGDGFVVKFNSTGTRQWATYYGGPDDEYTLGCATDEAGNVYLRGQTGSSSGIAFNGHQMSYAGAGDFYLAKFSETGTRLWATYYGGSSVEFIGGRGVATGANEVVYLAGTTASSTGIALNGHQNTNSEQSAFLARFGLDSPEDLTTGSISGSPFCEGAVCLVPFTASDIYIAGNIFSAQLSDGTGSFAAPVEIGTLTGTTSGTINATIPLGTPLGTGYRIRVVASDPATEGSENPNDLAVSNLTTWYPDEDGDGYGSPTGSLETCAPPGGYVQNNADDCPSVFGLIGSPCDDEDPTTENDIITEECECEGISVLPMITAYRYWFDDDIANAVTTTVDPVEELLIEEAFLADGLDGGLRRVSVQAQDNMGFWSSPQTSLFARVDAVVSGYRYWVNDDPSNMLTGTVTPAGVVDLSAALPISGADRPFNLITIQFLDPAGVYSAPLTKAFALTHGLVSGYRYWVNDDPSTMETVSATPVELLDLTSPLAIGIADRSFNILTIQFRDEGGIYSVPYTTTFVRSTGPIVQYEYWIDDVIADRVAGNVGPADVADLIDDLPTSAPPGPHVFTIRFRGESGAWSVPFTKAFVSNLAVFDCPDLEANIGDACDDGNGCTENDALDANCDCVGTPLPDSDGDGTCDVEDGCPEDENKIAPGICGCGTSDVDTDGDSTADCNDGCPTDPNKIAPGICGCGVSDVDTDGDSTADCNDGCPTDPNKIAPGICGCGVADTDTDNDGIADCNDACPLLPNLVNGNACDDGNAGTENDVVANCVCAGTPIGGGCNQNELEIAVVNDGVSVVSYQVFVQGTNTVAAGGTVSPPAGTYTPAICLPDGCFYLVVTDNGGDGITGGGYLLKIKDAQRLIDNQHDAFGRGGFTSGETSHIAANEGFCLPIGIDRLIGTSCDKMDWRTSCNGEYVVANDNQAVTEQYNATNSTSGYQMWWYNPNGGYSFKRIQYHSTANGMSASATRACHFKPNSWSPLNAGNTLQMGAFYNVKVRGIVAGNFLPWGAACRFMLNNTEAACPRTKLYDLPDAQFLSCGQTRAIATNVRVYARPVRRVTSACAWQNASRYQFRFRIPAEGVTITKTSAIGQYFVNTTGLTCGKTYEVDVRASFDNGSSWCHAGSLYGDMCLLSTTACAQGGNQNMALNGSVLAEQAAALQLYPNPNRGDQLYVNLTGIEASVGTVSVDIFDMTGQRVSARTIAINEGIVNTVLQLNGELANGLYLVTIMAGERRFVERLVVQP